MLLLGLDKPVCPHLNLLYEFRFLKKFSKLYSFHFHGEYLKVMAQVLVIFVCDGTKAM